VPNFEPAMLGTCYTPSSACPQRPILSQAAPLLENSLLFVSDGAQSSTSMIEPPNYHEPPFSNISPTPVPGFLANPTTSSPSLVAPPTGVSTPVYPSACGYLGQRKKETEVHAGEIDTRRTTGACTEGRISPLRCV